MTSDLNGDYLRTTIILRNSSRKKLHNEIQLYGFLLSKTATDIENNIYFHARNREEYLSFISRYILNLRELDNLKQNNGLNRINNIDEISKIVLETRAINDIIAELNYLYIIEENNQHKIEVNNVAIDFTNKIEQFQETSKKKFWSGIIELIFLNSTDNLTNYQLTCEIFELNKEMELNLQQIPDKLFLTLISSDAITQMMPILTEKSHQFCLQFSNQNKENELTNKMLENFMSNNSFGLIEFSSQNDKRFMIVLYLMKFIGFVPYDKNQLSSDIEQIIDNNRRIDQTNSLTCIVNNTNLINKQSIIITKNPILNSLINK